MTKYAKLVRDGIPGIVAKEGKTAVVRTLNEIEYRRALVEKLFEESAEVRGAAFELDNRMGKEGDLETEIADVLEVVESLAAAYGFDLEEVRKIQSERREKRGGFSDRIFLERIDE